MGIASSLGKKWADEASKGGSWARAVGLEKKFKTSGQVGKIEAGGKYGYGRGEAAEATRALQESRKTEFGAETMLGDIAGSYLSAGLSGGLSGGAKQLMSGEKGSIAKAFGGAPGTKTGWEGIKQSFGYELEGLSEGGKGEFTPGTASQADLPLTQEELGQSQLFGGEFESFDPSMTALPAYDDTAVSEEILPYDDTAVSEEIFAQGGQVIDQNTLLGLAILSQMQQQQQTAYSGTPLDNLSTGSTKKEKQHTSISDYFAMQGKTLGGNNTQSLSQMLGR
jgi:hypothetical protein